MGTPLIKYLFEEKVKKIIAVDVSVENVERAKKEFASKNLDVRVVDIDDISIFSTECDILSTCATGAVLNRVTIPLIKAKIICGAANNQLEDPDRDGKELFKREIVYVPDFLTNRMGIVNCANEQYGYVNNDPFIERHFSTDWEHSIYQMTLMVLKKSKKKGQQTGKVAVKLAGKLSKVNHPIFGHRGQQIIDSLVEDKWHEKI